MPSVSTFLVSLAAAGSFATALPSVDNAQPRTFSLKATYNKKHEANSHVDMARLHEKEGLALPDELASRISRLRKRTNIGSAPAEAIGGGQAYFVEAEIGTPPQKVKLNLDTGSSDLWLAHKKSLNTQESMEGLTLFDVIQSASATKRPELYYYVKYGDQKWSAGDIYMDTVTIGGLSAKNQVIGYATYMKGKDLLFGSGGYLGLAADSGNTVALTEGATMGSPGFPAIRKTWFSSIKDSLQSPLFTANIKHKADGNYNFGYINAAEHTSEIKYAPNDDHRNKWEFKASGYSFGDGNSDQAPRSAVVDSGADRLYISDDDFIQRYYESIGAQWAVVLDEWLFDCNEPLPDFSFWLGESKFTVPGSILNLGPVPSESLRKVTSEDVLDDQKDFCYGGPVKSPLGFDVLGLPLLQSLFVVFDAGNKQIGFATKAL